MRKSSLDLVTDLSVGVWLDGTDEQLARRIVDEQRSAATATRPLLESAPSGTPGKEQAVALAVEQVADRLSTMRDKRVEAFSAAAILRVITDHMQPDQIAEIISILNAELQRWKDRPDQYKVPLTVLGDGIRLRTGTQTGVIVVGAELFSAVLPLFASSIAGDRSTAVVLCDSAVNDSWGKEVASPLATAKRVELLTVPSGEPSKAFSNVAQLGEELLRLGIYRKDLFVAVGGGVVGDLGGLVASLYMRGIPLIHVPTTLVAQVDSAIGGKTAVNLPSAKNVLGTFYPGRAVIQDVRTLSTLPEREYLSGFGEVIKYGLLYEPRLLTLLEANREELIARSPKALAEVIVRCARMKAAVVAADVEDLTGIRAMLNLGHTVGHAIENLTGYGTYLHGEAISIGLQVALWLSSRFVEQRKRETEPNGGDREHEDFTSGFTEQVFRRTVHLLKSFGLPTAVPEELMAGSEQWLIQHQSSELQKPGSDKGSREGREKNRSRNEAVAGSATPGNVATGGAGDGFRDRWASPMLRDKKRSGADTVSFVLLEDLGKPYIRRLTMDEILRGIASSPLNARATR